jgi:hypothetical protein
MGALARAVLGIKSGGRKTEPVLQSKARAYEIRTVNDLAYFKDLIKQLERVAQRPVNVGNHAEMIEQVGKQNAYREILEVIRKDLETAERFIAGDQARQRQS